MTLNTTLGIQLYKNPRILVHILLDIDYRNHRHIAVCMLSYMRFYNLQSNPLCNYLCTPPYNCQYKM